MHGLPGVAWVIQEPRNAARKFAFWARSSWHDLSDQVRRGVSVVKGILRPRTESDLESSDGSEHKSPITPCMSPEPMSPTSLYRTGEGSALSPISERASMSVDAFEGTTAMSESGASVVAAAPPSSPARTRLQNLVRSVIMMRTASSATSAFSAVGPRRQRTMSSDGGKSRRSADHGAVMRSSRVASLIPKLKRMEATQDIPAHSALVRHIQFSPDGKYLATSR